MHDQLFKELCEINLDDLTESEPLTLDVIDPSGCDDVKVTRVECQSISSKNRKTQQTSGAKGDNQTL